MSKSISRGCGQSKFKFVGILYRFYNTSDLLFFSSRDSIYASTFKHGSPPVAESFAAPPEILWNR